MSRLARLRTLARLGPGNIARVAMYRLGLRSGWHPVQRLRGAIPRGPFYRAAAGRAEIPAPNRQWRETALYFGWYRPPLPDQPLDWFANPFSDRPQPDASRDWWRIGDFGSGDIKGLWELSRLDWAVAWGTKAAHGDARALARLNQWLGDWAAQNPPYKGPNWKCGQEASIRVMHLCLVAWILGQDDRPEPGLVALLVAHLRRIAPTTSYAIGQANNHGTSEAAALFIGGSFLAGHDPRAGAWARKGRHLLEERARALIGAEGSFSQYSVTYHRVMLDSYALAEAWRRHQSLPAFSGALNARLSAAATWLFAMTDAESGDAPNIGANDGARLMPLTDSDYRDFRPSVQLGMALFHGRRAFDAGPWDDALTWLGIVLPEARATAPARSFDDGGYHVLRRGGALAVLRYPRFRFRPGQADALHLDLWHGGRNLLRDAGTYSYNAEGAEWFGGTGAHNTVEFDGRDQMPRLGRFLFGDWLAAEAVEPVHATQGGQVAEAGYTDGHGARHHRRVVLGDGHLTVTDRIGGQFGRACLRWRMAPGDYALGDFTVTGGGMSLQIKAEGCLPHLNLTRAPESRYYLRKDDLPVLELTLDGPATITTRISF
ncbi:MAG: heparinase II/III-family protein [Rhodobacteraceae bacterium]|nr:heparinase II/III-family protein [Paracoccaceae bacterium]